MSSPTQPEVPVQEITLDEIIAFVRKRFGAILIYGVFSLVITSLIIAALFFFLPRKERYVSSITLLLPKTSNSMTYPSNNPFSAADILSTTVLKNVYDANNLSTRIKFDDFCALFSFSRANMDKAFLAASYRDKLSKKNISVTDLRALEEEYKSKLNLLDTAALEIAMTPTLLIKSSEAVKILHDIPASWYALYSKTEAKTLPRTESTAQIETLRKNLDKEGKLLLLDKTRIKCRKLAASCKNLQELLNGRTLTLPSGETLDDLQEKLAHLETYKVRLYLQIILETPALQSSYDAMFLKANIKELQNKLSEINSGHEGALAAVELLNSGKPERDKGTPAKENAGAMTINVDSNFFNSISSLIRNTQSIKLREEYAKKVMECKESAALITSELNYYTSLLKLVTGSSKTSSNALITAPSFTKLTEEMFDELLSITHKINEIHNLFINTHLTERDFYATNGEVLKERMFHVPFKRIVAGLLILCILINVLKVAADFYSMFTKGELKK